jgi:hypothetical protein
MRARSTLTAIVSALVAVGCGQSGDHSAGLMVQGVPLVGGARVVAQVRSCDRGASAYCALQLVVVGSGFQSSADLLAHEEGRLHARGWTLTVGDTPQEHSADSPGHRLRLSYALAPDDLLSWDRGQIRRRPVIARALAQAMFQRAPTLSLMLQTGSS